MSLFKTNLTATNLNVTNLTVTTLPNTNGIFATNSQAVNTSVNNKIVSPGALKVSSSESCKYWYYRIQHLLHLHH